LITVERGLILDAGLFFSVRVIIKIVTTNITQILSVVCFY